LKLGIYANVTGKT
jgi:hypothetical protein